MIRPEKLALAAFPSPIHKLRTLRKDLNREIYIKRDDSTGMLLSGNKIRKLEFLLREALDMNANAVVTCGGPDSNHVRTTTIAAKLLGLKPFAVLRGTESEILDGNLLLTSIAGAELSYVTESEYDSIDVIYSDMNDRLAKQGLRPYFIPEGASNALGCWGYITMMEELALQQKEMDIRFDSIFTALGSGGTLGGLLIGKYVTKSPANIFGINVFSADTNFREIITAINSEAIQRCELPCELHASDIQYFDDYIGRGYAKTSDSEIRFILKVAQSEGVILDHVYTGKALLGTVDLLKRNASRLGKRILFIHTGGWFNIFKERERITNLTNIAGGSAHARLWPSG